MICLLGVRCPAEESRETARRLLAFSVRLVWGWTELPPMDRTGRGKPFFPGRPGRQFSLSHAGGLAVCALSDGGPVGVDVEPVRPHAAGLPAYVMTPEELAAFDGRWEDFARVWTLKEAWVKYLGRSVWPPRTAPVPPPVPHRSYAGPGWRAALCAAPGAGALPDSVRWLSLPPEDGTFSRP